MARGRGRGGAPRLNTRPPPPPPRIRLPRILPVNVQAQPQEEVQVQPPPVPPAPINNEIQNVEPILPALEIQPPPPPAPNNEIQNVELILEVQPPPPPPNNVQPPPNIQPLPPINVQPNQVVELAYPVVDMPPPAPPQQDQREDDSPLIQPQPLPGTSGYGLQARWPTARSHFGPMHSSPILGKNPGRKMRRFRPGTVALREIRFYQKRTQLLITRAPFRRLVKEIGDSIKMDMRFPPSTCEVIQEAAEAYLIEMFECANLLAIHSNRVTINDKDLKLVIRLQEKRN